MQAEVCQFMQRQSGKKFTAREVSSKLRIPAKNVRTALVKLSKSGIVDRFKSVNVDKHFEYKYKVRL